MQTDLFEKPREAPQYEVIWAKTWEGNPILKPCDCRHEGADALPINHRLEPAKRGGGDVIAMDASICMACGVDSTGNLSLVDGLKACMDEYGWRREAGLRLYDLAEFHQDELREGCCPIWMWSAFGFTGKEIVDMLNSGDLEECSK